MFLFCLCQNSLFTFLFIFVFDWIRTTSKKFWTNGIKSTTRSGPSSSSWNAIAAWPRRMLGLSQFKSTEAMTVSTDSGNHFTSFSLSFFLFFFFLAYYSWPITSRYSAVSFSNRPNLQCVNEPSINKSREGQQTFDSKNFKQEKVVSISSVARAVAVSISCSLVASMHYEVGQGWQSVSHRRSGRAESASVHRVKRAVDFFFADDERDGGDLRNDVK